MNNTIPRWRSIVCLVIFRLVIGKRLCQLSQLEIQMKFQFHRRIDSDGFVPCFYLIIATATGCSYLAAMNNRDTIFRLERQRKTIPNQLMNMIRSIETGQCCYTRNQLQTMNWLWSENSWWCWCLASQTTSTRFWSFQFETFPSTIPSKWKCIYFTL